MTWVTLSNQTESGTAIGRKALPWNSTSPAEEQIRFIECWQRGEASFTRLCERFGISPKTGYKRVNRFRAYGWEGLGDRSRAPHTRPTKTPQEVAELLVATKLGHMTWGPRKLIPWLRVRQPQVDWPAPSTASSILERAGLVRRRRRARRAAPWGEPFAEADKPNDVWCADFKGWFNTADGARCNPLTVVDASSRYLLACRGLTHPRGPQVQRTMERVFREYGLPRAIRTDNGPPFASVGLGGLSPLAVWWVKLGIIPERTEPGHPEQNGRLERLHRTLKAETASPPQKTMHAQQRSFDAFRKQYNQERPHEALAHQTPASQYTASVRSYPSRVPEIEYEVGVTVRRVRTNGQIKWRGGMLYLSEALKGEPVGLSPHDDRHWRIQFGPLQIGLLDTYSGTVLQTPSEVLPMSSD